jgi:hypothetical protein
MQPDQNVNVDHGRTEVILPKTKLTEAIRRLQDMFPNMNTAIIDRALITTNGDLSAATEKLIQISSKFK